MAATVKLDLPHARRDAIAARLANGRSVKAAELADEFRVSEDAIRRDLRALASQGLCRRVYGGALPLTAATAPLTRRIEELDRSVDRFGRAVAERVGPSELVFLDSGSTNFAVVDFLPDDRNLMIATNSVPIAAAVLRRKELDLLMIGGKVDAAVGGSIDATAMEEVSKLNIDLCLLGACAVSARGGISTVDSADRAFKRRLLAVSRRTIVLATTWKLGTDAPYRVAELEEIETILVEDDAPTEALDALARGGARIARVGDRA